MHIKILKPGLLTTIQDLGRFGHRQEGIILSGAMDSLSLRLSNLLVGNPAEAAALEITLMGPKILFKADSLISLTGADLNASLNSRPVNRWRPVFVRADSVLEFGTPRIGCRTYLAVSGGFNIPKILGSYATYLRASLGGLHGKALQTGDTIPLNQPTASVGPLLKELKQRSTQNGFAETNWSLNLSFYPPLYPDPVVRVIKGPEYEWFTPDSQLDFWKDSFVILPQSDRMGYQLLGPALSLLQQKELLSTAVTFGTVQVPAQGNPIVLMADHQTTGGYPRLAQVITADFSILAQLRPGEIIRFKEIGVPEAQQLYLQQARNLESLEKILSLKFKI